jgi:hypothetical protein
MASDRPSSTDMIYASIDQSIAEPLVISLAVVVLHVLLGHSPKMALAQRNHLAHAL